MKQRTKLTRFYLDSAQRLSLCLQQDQLVLLINYCNQRNADLIKYVFKKILNFLNVFKTFSENGVKQRYFAVMWCKLSKKKVCHLFIRVLRYLSNTLYHKWMFEI